MQFKAPTLVPSALAWVVLAVTASGVAVATLQTGVYCIREFSAVRRTGDVSHAPSIPVATNPVPSPSSHEGFAGRSISARSFDDLVRLSAKLAHEQGIDVVQLQSEAVTMPPTHLNQLHIRLQVRGDYVATKSFLISLLANFPGLTLEHLTIRHGATAGLAGSPTAASPGASEESTIELIQYSQSKPVAA